MAGESRSVNARKEENVTARLLSVNVGLPRASHVTALVSA